MELADGLLAHRKPAGGGRYTIDTTTHFPSDRGTPTGMDRVWQLFWAAWRWTGERKSLDPLMEEGAGVLNMIGANALDMLNVREQWGKQLLSPGQVRGRAAGPLHFAWQLTGNKALLEELYDAQIRASAVREYINTEGSVWSDRVTVDHVELQRAAAAWRSRGITFTLGTQLAGSSLRPPPSRASPS